MTLPNKHDERIWSITILSDACPFHMEIEDTECCLLRHYKHPGDEVCAFEKCPKKSKDNGDYP